MYCRCCGRLEYKKYGTIYNSESGIAEKYLEKQSCRFCDAQIMFFCVILPVLLISFLMAFGNGSKQNIDLHIEEKSISIMNY